jgi:hypothetical protein
MALYWKRFVKVTFGKRGDVGVAIEGLSIDFEVVKSDTSEVNTATIDIKNLNKTSRGILDNSTDLFVSIEVAYGSDKNYELLFQGDIITAVSIRQGVDWNTKIQAGDGHYDLKYVSYRKTFKNGYNSDLILSDIASGFRSIKLGDVAQLKGEKLIGSTTFSKKASDAIDQIVRQQGLTWFVDNEILRILSPSLVYDSSNALLLTPETGLLGSPFAENMTIPNWKRQTDESTGKPEKEISLTRQISGLKFEALLNPLCSPGRGVEIKCKSVSGQYKIKKAAFRGSTRENQWSVSCSSIPLGDANVI